MATPSGAGSPFARAGLPLLDTHAAHIAAAAAACHAVYVFGCMLSTANPHYARLSHAKQASWGMHVVSASFSATICSLAIPIFFLSPELNHDPIFGYSYYGGVVYSIACGYFIWDTLISIYYVSESGLGFVIHGISCLTVFLLSFRPFLQYFGSVFLMFELSTIFLNVHWFCDKTGLTGSRLQWINGIILLITFFTVRIVFGLYQSSVFFTTCISRWSEVPKLLFSVYAFANIVLNGLNLWWFSRMVASVRSRFAGSHDESADGSYGKITRHKRGGSHKKRE